MKSLIIAAAFAVIGFTGTASANSVMPVNTASSMIAEQSAASGQAVDLVEYRFRKRHHRHYDDGFFFEFGFGDRDYRRHYERDFYRPRVIHRPRPVIRLTRAHIEWCYDHYRSYDHRTNTFIRSGGREVFCRSPFLR
jgi:hypothetical protein